MSSCRREFLVPLGYLVAVLNCYVLPAAAKRSFRYKECDKDSRQHWLDDNCWRDDDDQDEDPEDDDDPNYTIYYIVGFCVSVILVIMVVCWCCCVIKRRRMKKEMNEAAANQIATAPIRPYFTDPKPHAISAPFPDQPHRANTEFLHPSPMQYYETVSYQNPNGQFNEPPPPYSLVDEVQRIGQSSSDRPTAPPG